MNPITMPYVLKENPFSWEELRNYGNITGNGPIGPLNAYRHWLPNNPHSKKKKDQRKRKKLARRKNRK